MAKHEVARSASGPIEVSLGPRTKSLWIRAGWRPIAIDLAPVRHAPALASLLIDSKEPELSTIDLAPLSGHPSLGELHLRCRGLRALDLAPLAAVPRLHIFNCVDGDLDLDVTPLCTAGSLARLGNGRYVIDPNVDVEAMTSPGVRAAIAERRVRRRGIPAHWLERVTWSLDRTFADHDAFVRALPDDTREVLERAVLPVRSIRVHYDDLRTDAPPLSIDIQAVRDDRISGLEVLSALDHVLAPLLAQRDASFFEGLTLIDRPLSEPLTYELCLGS